MAVPSLNREAPSKTITHLFEAKASDSPPLPSEAGKGTLEILIRTFYHLLQYEYVSRIANRSNKRRVELP